MTAAIIVAVISAVVSLFAAALAARNARRLAVLNDQLEEGRRMRTKQEQAAELRARFRDPLLSAVFDLQSRLYNIVTTKFLVRYRNDPDAAARQYAIDSTLFVLAEYLGWVEIIRREIQFLDLGDEQANRAWVDALEKVRDTLARDDIDAALRIFRAEQRAIGELMTTTAVDPSAERPACIGYASFTERAADPNFARWFDKLRTDLDLLGRELEDHLARPVLLQNALIDVLDVLDKDCVRFLAARRARLPAPELSAPASSPAAAPEHVA